MGKIRVYELAKDLGVNSKVLLDRMQQMGLPVKSYMSTLEDEEISRLKEAFVKKERQPQPIPKAPTQAPGPARGAAPSGTRPVQTGAPRPPERTPGGGTGTSPASGRPSGAPGASGAVRTSQNNASAKVAQTPARPPQAKGGAVSGGHGAGAAPVNKPGARPAQTGGPASGGAVFSGARSSGPGAGAARPVQAAKPARAGAQATAKTNASNQDQKVVIDREDYRKRPWREGKNSGAPRNRASGSCSPR
jgi:translation initiation factor IF-2